MNEDKIYFFALKKADLAQKDTLRRASPFDLAQGLRLAQGRQRAQRKA
jgi:hypothetical protein